MQAYTADASLAYEQPSEPLFHRIWPPAFIIASLGLTAGWVSFLGYSVVRLIIT